jgi:hypothetical protein
VVVETAGRPDTFTGQNARYAIQVIPLFKTPSTAREDQKDETWAYRVRQ